MELFDAIKARHCYRGEFLAEKISREDLEKMVTAGLLAPSGRNAQTTEFVIVDDPELLAQIRQLHNMPAVQSAAAMIVCLIDKEPEPVYEGRSFQVEDCAAAVENILLAIAAMDMHPSGSMALCDLKADQIRYAKLSAPHRAKPPEYYCQ